MSVALASAWHPRSELPRFQNLRPQLARVYNAIVLSVPPDTDRAIVRVLEAQPLVFVVVTADWSHGRHAALQKALETSASHIHYNDFDRLLHWAETRPKEWRSAVAVVEKGDCLIVGRTVQAYATHPQALIQTEAISNAVFAPLLGQAMDLSAESKGFSRRAAEFLMSNSPPGRALGMDSEWPVLLHRAGFRIDYIEVDGLDWESADHHQPSRQPGNSAPRSRGIRPRPAPLGDARTRCNGNRAGGAGRDATTVEGMKDEGGNGCFFIL